MKEAALVLACVATIAFAMWVDFFAPCWFFRGEKSANVPTRCTAFFEEDGGTR